jgi:hypothetical protein
MQTREELIINSGLYARSMSSTGKRILVYSRGTTYVGRSPCLSYPVATKLIVFSGKILKIDQQIVPTSTGHPPSLNV